MEIKIRLKKNEVVTKKERKNSIMKIDLCIGKNGEEACSACTANSASKNRNVYFF